MEGLIYVIFRQNILFSNNFYSASVIQSLKYKKQWSANFLSISFGQVILFQFSSFSRKTYLTKGIFFRKNYAYKWSKNTHSCLSKSPDWLPEQNSPWYSRSLNALQISSLYLLSINVQLSLFNAWGWIIIIYMFFLHMINLAVTKKMRVYFSLQYQPGYFYMWYNTVY